VCVTTALSVGCRRSHEPTQDPAVLRRPARAVRRPDTPRKPADPPKADEGKTFTQADVERIIAGRLSKFADYDEVKTKLSKIEDANATETEKAIKAAREEARIETLRESAPERVRLAFEAAAGQRMTAAQIEEFLEDVDTTKYLTDTGAIDRDRVAKKIDALAPAKTDEPPKTAPSFGGGPRKSEPARAGSLGEAIASKIASRPR
jgi:hypothetical protein